MFSGRGESNSRCKTPSLAYCHYTTARNLSANGGFGERFNARSANFNPFAIEARPLQIDVFAITVDRIIITAQEFALICHHRFFSASGTAVGHIKRYI